MITIDTTLDPSVVIRRRYLRPLWLGILVATAGELVVFVVFGLMLSGTANWPAKLAWTVGFCGVGMGSTVGALVDLLLVERWAGLRAILATTLLSTGILGIACNLLCWRLDLGLHYFGGAEHPAVFLVSGIVGATIGGVLMGWLLFSTSGQQWLEERGV